MEKWELNLRFADCWAEALSIFTGSFLIYLLVDLTLSFLIGWKKYVFNVSIFRNIYKTLKKSILTTVSKL